MLTFDEFYFDSRDKRTKIHAVRWTPTGEVRCVLQIVHGMAEHMARYDEFARFLAAEGILVVGCDHLGHGKTANSEEELGYFCENDAATVLVRDVHRLKKLMQAENMGKPYFILGHSMGSFIARNYMFRYSQGIDGVILTGCAGEPNSKARFGQFLSRMLAVFYGWKHKSPLIDRIAFGNHNKRVENPKSKNDWICTDPAVVDRYDADDRCGFLFTLNGFDTLAQFALDSNKEENYTKIRRDLPVYLLSGTEDPAGAYGTQAEKLYQNLLAAGLTDVHKKMYEGDRHEILNERDRFVVYEDILKFVLERVQK